MFDNIHSSYWIEDSDDDYQESQPTTPLEHLVRLASIRRAIANFVHILTGDSKILVEFSSGKDSYTDGKHVVISAEHNMSTFDSRVGLALHEASHCLLTDFDFIRNLVHRHPNGPSKDNYYTFYGTLHPDLRRMFDMDSHIVTDKDGRVKFHRVVTLLTHLHGIMHQVLNIVEDRRIDSYVYRTAPGYRAYYDALYAEYMYSPETVRSLRADPARRIPSVSNYLDWLTFMFATGFDRNALPGLGDMVDIVDIPNIRRFDQPPVQKDVAKWIHATPLTCENKLVSQVVSLEIYDHEQFSELWKVVNQITILILRYATKGAKRSEVNLGRGGKIKLDVSHFPDKLPNMTLPNLDLPSLNPQDRMQLDAALEKLRNAVRGEVDKKLLDSSTDAQNLKNMEVASAEITETTDPHYGTVPCLVVRNVNKTIIQSSWFPFSYNVGGNAVSNPSSISGVAAGFRMGAILTNKLQIRNDQRITHYTRQDSGKIDRRLLAQLGMDINSVFKKTTIGEAHPVMFHLSLDASSSMNGLKWEKVMTVATAMAFASTKITNLDIVISLRGTTGTGLPVVVIAFDSRVDGVAKIRSVFPMLHPRGSTPEGLCFASTLDLITECASTHTTYFINYSDGEPMCGFSHNGKWTDYNGTYATTQTRNAINRIRQSGMKVMSYFIEGTREVFGNKYRKMFDDMYGQDAEYVDVRNVTQVIRTLNKLLITES